MCSESRLWARTHTHTRSHVGDGHSLPVVLFHCVYQNTMLSTLNAYTFKKIRCTGRMAHWVMCLPH